MRETWLAVLCAAALAVLAGCGDRGPTEEERARGVVEAFARATAAKDYQALCDRILAPKLIEQVQQVGLPCEVALRQGLGDVRDPRLVVGRVAVTGDAATADVRTSAAGQEPSSDILRLVRSDGTWRIASLAGAGPG